MLKTLHDFEYIYPIKNALGVVSASRENTSWNYMINSLNSLQSWQLAKTSSPLPKQMRRTQKIQSRK